MGNSPENTPDRYPAQILFNNLGIPKELHEHFVAELFNYRW